MSHTPGPWTVIKAQTDSKHSIFVRDHPFKVATGIDSDANARVIAAAPELLAALKIAVDNDLSRVEEKDRYRWLKEARSAIRKAEGG